MPLWSDGQITLRADSGQFQTVGRPFALIGRTDGSDLRLADRDVSARHVYLHLDRRGLFAVDLATRTGSRFDGVAAPAAWLRNGSIVEVCGRRVEVFARHPDGRPWAEAPHDGAYHLTDATGGPLARLSLHPLPSPNTPWTLNSELVFLGRSAACGVPIVGGSAARVHAVVVRTPAAAYIVNLAGWGVWLDGGLVRTAARLEDGAMLVAGSSRFEIRVEPAPEPTAAPALRIAPEPEPDAEPEPPFDAALDLADADADADADSVADADVLTSIAARLDAGIDLATLGALNVAAEVPAVPIEPPAPPAPVPPPATPPAAPPVTSPPVGEVGGGVAGWGGSPGVADAAAAPPAAGVVPLVDVTVLPAGLAPPPGLVGGEAQAAMMGWLLGAVQAVQGEMLRRQDEFQHELVRALHALHRDNQDALELHQERVDAIHKELTDLREDIRKRFNAEIPAPRVPRPPRPGTPPPRIAPPPIGAGANAGAGADPDAPPADPAAATAWLLNRVNRLDEANRNSWRNLLGRLGPKPS
jgi:pSer/pThr/pTyr-binding forkhead associated (FHA) protein